MKFKKWFEYLGDALVIVFGLWSLLMFISVLSTGKISFVEHNMAILVTETIVAGLIVIFGIERLIDDLHKGGKL